MRLFSIAMLTSLVFVPLSTDAQDWRSWKSPAKPISQPSQLPPASEQQAERTDTAREVLPEPDSAASTVVRSPASIVLLPGDISKPYDILGNVEVEVKGRDSEQAAQSKLREQAQVQFDGEVDAIIFFKNEMRVANILAGYLLKGGFDWRASGVAVRFQSSPAHDK